MKKRIRQANRKFSLGQTENELGQNMYQFFLDETYNYLSDSIKHSDRNLTINTKRSDFFILILLSWNISKKFWHKIKE